jgi:hypothetical protein
MRSASVSSRGPSCRKNTAQGSDRWANHTPVSHTPGSESDGQRSFDAGRCQAGARVTIPAQRLREGNGGRVADEPIEEWMQRTFSELTSSITDISERMLNNGDDRVTILGMIQSAVLHGLHDAGFSDETF